MSNEELNFKEKVLQGRQAAAQAVLDYAGVRMGMSVGDFKDTILPHGRSGNWALLFIAEDHAPENMEDVRIVFSNKYQATFENPNALPPIADDIFDEYAQALRIVPPDYEPGELWVPEGFRV
jgi:hypothetical protein